MLINEGVYLKKLRDKSTKQKQIDLGLKHSKFEFIYKFKRIVRDVEKDFTALPLWRGELVWIAIVFMIFTSIVTTILIKNSYDKLPPYVPILYNISEESWYTFPKVYLFMIPFIILILGILNINYFKKVYYMNKKLSGMICIILIIVYVFEVIAVKELVNLNVM